MNNKHTNSPASDNKGTNKQPDMKATDNQRPTMNDFSVPRRMSKSAFVVILYHDIKQNINFFFIFVVLNLFNRKEQISFTETSIKLLLILAGILVFSCLTAFLNYYYKKFYVKDGNLIFMRGVFHRETTSIPVNRFHSMRTKRGPLYRLLDMKGVTFDTLASKTEEIELILDDADWDALHGLVEAQENAPEVNKPTESSEVHKGNKEETTIRFSNSNLIKGAFCQNHLKGMTVLASAILVLFGKVYEYNEDALVYAFEYCESKASLLSPSITALVTLLAGMYFFMLILWIGKVILRYFNMEVHMNKTQLFFEGGLFTRQSSQFSYDKVCTVYVKQNILEKWANCCTINLRQALNATDQKDESDVKIYGSNAAGYFLDWWLGKEFAASQPIISAHSGNGLLGFKIKYDILLTLIALGVLWHFEQTTWMFIPFIYILISLVKGIFSVYHSCITLKDDYLVINNGQFANVSNYLKYSNVEVVKLVQTPFTPYFHRVNLIISTNGTSFTIRSLKETEAGDIYELLLYRCRETDKPHCYS